MSARDPLLTDLKGILQKLKELTRPVDDTYPDIHKLFTILEDIFKKGLKKVNTLFGLSKKDYWNWIAIVEQHFRNERPSAKFAHTLEAVLKSKKVKTNLGRGRLFIRLALNQGLLGVPVKIITTNDEFLNTYYDCTQSVIGNDLLSESLTSLLFWASEIKFDFNVKNSSFLDETWVIPVYQHFELVPSKSLGVVVRHIWDRIIVAEVKPGSVAADENKIEAGDVFDELYGESLYATVKGRIPTLLKSHAGWPISLAIIKCHLPSGKVFEPLKPRYEQMSLEYPAFIEPRDRDENRGLMGSIQGVQEEDYPPMESLSGSSFHRVQFIGKTSTGEMGGTEVIEDAVKTIMENESNVKKDLVIEVGEMFVRFYDPASQKLLMKYCYPEISSCGRRMDNPNCLALVIGDTTCSISRNFECFLFEARSEFECRQILQSTAQGFGRTADCV